MRFRGPQALNDRVGSNGACGSKKLLKDLFHLTIRTRERSSTRKHRNLQIKQLKWKADLKSSIALRLREITCAIRTDKRPKYARQSNG